MGSSERELLPPVDFPWVQNLSELVRPETTVSLVNALLLATRRMMSNGAMTCSIRRHISQPVKSSRLWKSTNLSLGKDRYENVRGAVPSARRSKNQQRAHSVQGRRLDEHGNDDLVQSANSTFPRGSANVSGVEDEPDDDHEGEEDVERQCDRKVRKSEPDAAGQFRGLVDKHDTHRYIEDVSLECRRQVVDNVNAYPMSQGT